jgi:F5/8 type C domain
MQTFPGRPFVGSVDFMDLFTPDSEWESTAAGVHVFHLYGEWLGRDAGNDELERVVADLDRRGIAISLSGGALEPVACSGDVEGFAGIREGVRISQRIRDAGGIAHFYAFDHAYDAGTAAPTPAECRITAEEVAAQVKAFEDAIREIFPDIVFGDDVTAGLDVEEVARWVEAYRTVVGEDIGFIHVDIDFGIPNWADKVKAIEDYLRSEEIDFGLFYLGDGTAPSDESWITTAGERVKIYEIDAGGRPDHVVFGSWNDKPDYVLPDTNPFTFTGFIRQYLEDSSLVGVRTAGPAANLAYKKPVTASAESPGLPARQAVDGLFDTWWGSGGPPSQWIQIDLGAPAAVARIRLTVSQDPSGETAHRVLGWGPGEEPRLLHEFAEETVGDQLLEHAPPDPWQGIQFVRIETVASPSWVSWREIELLAP